MDLKPGYKESIEVYREAYIKLEAPASPKVHIISPSFKLDAFIKRSINSTTKQSLLATLYYIIFGTGPNSKLNRSDQIKRLKGL